MEGTKVSGHHVNSTQHPTGSHALWEEVLRLRNLLRRSLELAAPLCSASGCEKCRVRRELRDDIRKELGQ